jgi:DNA-directed RNA polymerase specialized sigma24 family protein
MKSFADIDAIPAVLSTNTRDHDFDRLLAAHGPALSRLASSYTNTLSDRDDLLQEMASRLEQAARQPCEKVWLVGWDVSGAGALVEALAERRFRDELAADLAELDPLAGVTLHTHSLRVHASSPAARPIAVHDELAGEFVARLDERFARGDAALRDCVASSALRGGPWEVKLETLLVELDAGEVAHDACRMAMHWFGAPEELSS